MSSPHPLPELGAGGRPPCPQPGQAPGRLREARLGPHFSGLGGDADRGDRRENHRLGVCCHLSRAAREGLWGRAGFQGTRAGA